MSLQAPVLYVIPEETVRVARAAFPKGNPYLLLADHLGLIYANSQFRDLFSSTGQPALDPARLALVTLFQFMEGLSDAQAADAVRSRLDWKYALALPLTDPGFDRSVLCEFRARLRTGGQETLLLDTLLATLQEQGLLKARGTQRTDSTQVLAAVRVTSRLVCCGETLRAALNAVAAAAPDWLQALSPPAWFERYSRRVEDYHLPKGTAARAEWAATIGRDGHDLLNALYAPSAPAGLWQLPAVQVLRAVWVQQFEAPTAAGQVRWRADTDLPPGALLIVSPYDLEARLSAKGEQTWVGYKVHLTETCDPDLPHLITQVETTLATMPDDQALPAVHRNLAARKLLPQTHYVDAGYVDAHGLVSSRQEQGVRLVGPLRADTSWQAHAGQGYAAACFGIDWEAQVVTCPAGTRSTKWQPGQDAAGAKYMRVEFARATCAGCAVREACTQQQQKGRQLTLLPQEEHAALQAGRAYQTTAEFKAEYAGRAGIEGTLSQGVRRCDLRQARYCGLAKTRLQHILIAAALTLVRVVAWWRGDPQATTRQSAFAALAPARTLALRGAA